MDKKTYVSLLEQAVDTTNFAPSNVSDIISYRGKGELKTSIQDKEIDDLVDKITNDDEDEDEDDLVTENDDIFDSPLSLLEKEANENDEDEDEDDEDLEDIEKLKEDVGFSDNESDILKRLIQEMEAVETEDEELINDDELMDEDDEDELDLEDED
ncbi:MAG: hypothetical protein U9Q17_04105 [Chloroflexota bacterium]|nr:hypothetical protein [Chloroflexota bacterium]